MFRTSRHAARTTAWYLGAQERSERIVAPPRIWLYGCTLNALLIALAWVGFAQAQADRGSSAPMVWLAALSFGLLICVYSVRRAHWHAAACLHLVATFLPILVLTYPLLPDGLATATLLLFFLPVALARALDLAQGL